MGNAIRRRDDRLREIQVSEPNRAGGDGCFGDFVNKMEAVILLGRVSNVEADAVTQVPSGMCGGLVADEDSATEGVNRSGVVIEGVVEVFPG